MEKIAIILYGHMRTYDKTYQSLYENIIKPNERKISFDIFLSTWKEKNIGEKFITEVDKEKIKKIYNLTNSLFFSANEEIYQDFKNSVYKNSPLVSVNVAFLLKKGCELIKKQAIKNGLDYKFVIITRPDIYFHQKLKFDDLISNRERTGLPLTDSRNIYIPYVISDYPGQINDFSIYSCGIDLFSIIPYDAIDLLSSLDLNKVNNHGLLPEFFLTKNYTQAGYNFKLLGYQKDRSFEILRKRGVVGTVIFSKYIQKIITSLIFILIPFLLLSIKFRRFSLFNKHLLSIRNLKKLIIFLKS